MTLPSGVLRVACQLPPSHKDGLNALWGKLASEILMQNWDNSLEDLNILREAIDSNVSNATDYSGFDTAIPMIPHDARKLCSILVLLV